MANSIDQAGGAAYTPNNTLDDLGKTPLESAPKQPGAYRKAAGAVVAGVGNVFFPGLGTAIGGMIAGGGIGGIGGLGGEAQQYLEMQRKVQAESRAFEAASTILKVRHDASMSAIRNMK